MFKSQREIVVVILSEGSLVSCQRFLARRFCNICLRIWVGIESELESYFRAVIDEFHAADCIFKI